MRFISKQFCFQNVSQVFEQCNIEKIGSTMIANTWRQYFTYQRHCDETLRSSPDQFHWARRHSGPTHWNVNFVWRHLGRDNWKV